MKIIISKEDALKVYYYLMYADGLISDDETALFDQILLTIHRVDQIEGFDREGYIEIVKEPIVNECNAEISGIEGKKNKFIKAFELIKEILKKDDYSNRVHIVGLESMARMNGISNKVFIWNLLALALADNEYAEEEKEIIDYIIDKVENSHEDITQFNQIFVTATAILKELEWINSIDESEEQKEMMKSELLTRLEVIRKQIYYIVKEEE